MPDPTNTQRKRPSSQKLVTGIFVQGRFHAFELARELIQLGEPITVFTNYPKRVAARFGLSPEKVRSHLFHGLASRLLPRLVKNPATTEEWLHRSFSQWASRSAAREPLDVAHCFSGVAEELFQSLTGKPVLRSLLRGSAHIETQARLLAEEEKRAGKSIDRPSPWMIAREKREYECSDVIVTLSDFAARSFEAAGFSATRLARLPLGSDLKLFRASTEVIAERCRRIENAEKLRVLTVGNASFQKGLLDLVAAAKKLSDQFAFEVVGAISTEAIGLAEEAGKWITFRGKLPQHFLPAAYAEADLFLFPTIHDGFAVVLSQAAAAGLPIIATTNCGSAEVVSEGKTGWIVPIRSPDVIAERLLWCDQHRTELAEMVRQAHACFTPRDYADVARDFVAIHRKAHQKQFS